MTSTSDVGQRSYLTSNPASAGCRTWTPSCFSWACSLSAAGTNRTCRKSENKSLIMEGSYLAFETMDLYRRMGLERNGFWIWEKIADLPKLGVEDQEKLLQIGILNYFDQMN